MLKKNLKIIRNIIILLIVVGLIYLYTTSNYIYIVGNNLLEQTYIIYGGEVDVKDQPIIRIDSSKTLIPITKKKEVNITNIKDEKVVYEVIQIKNLKPLKEYEVNLEFMLSGLDYSPKLTIGYQPNKINSIEDETQEQQVSNLDLTNSVSFAKAEDDYLSVPLTITANEEGKGYFYIGMDVAAKDTLAYNLSNVRIQI
ncbi:MAG: hypothetical protein ACK5HR_03765 [Mycoplasmatales bacterium]